MKKIQSYTHEYFFSKIPNLENKTLLDIGAGSTCDYSLMGYISFLDGKNEKSESEKNVLAIDLDFKGRLSTVLPRASLCADARELPLVKESFDIVAMGWLFDLFEDSERDKLVKEAARVVKPNGYLVGDVPLHPGLLSRYGGLGFIRWPIDSLKYSKQRKEYRKVIRSNGFEFLEEGIGIQENLFPRHLAFYFIVQKK